MRTLVSDVYRRVVPESVRGPIYRLRQRRHGILGRAWDRWANQTIEGPLHPRDLATRRTRYARRRTVMVARAKRRFVREYRSKLTTDTQFRLAAIASRFYERGELRVDHVMYESYNCRDFAGNPYALFRYLLEHPDYRHLHHVIAIDDLDNPKVAPYRSHERVHVVKVHTEAFIEYAETCKYYINNASYKPYLIKRPGQIYFTSWHSTLLKKLAKDSGRPWEAANVSRALVASDIHISPNSYTTEHLFRSHGVDGLVRGRVYEMGYPRNDLTVNADKAAIRRRLGVADHEKVVVYAPTWRGSYVPADTAGETLDHAEQIRARLPRDHKLFVKFHTLVYRYVDEATVAGTVPRDLDINEVLGATDLLITDYSGIFFDYLLTGNPVIYFTPDRTTYTAAKSGLYLDLESLPGPICDDVESLAAVMGRLDSVRSEYAARYQHFVTRYLSGDDGKACQRAVEVLFGLEDHRAHLSTAPGAAPDDDKQDLLFYPANLAGNGVTESFIALMSQLDHDRFNAVVLLPSTTKYRDAQRRLDHRAKVFYQGAPDGYLEDEYVKERSSTTFGARDLTDVPVRAFQRTVRRVFGDLTFYVAINYNGYFPNAAAKIATGVDARKKIVYLHNDLEMDRTIKHGQLLSVFSMYRFYDALVCVSADSLEGNRQGAVLRSQYVFGADPGPRMTFARNTIVPDRIRARAAAGSVIPIDGDTFLIVRSPGADEATGFRFDPSQKNLVCVGRLSPEKNHDRLLRAVREVVEDREDVTLYVVGTGDLDSRLRSTAEALGLAKVVVFTGFVSNPLPLVAQADCFVLASDIEGQPITVLEAMVLDRPIIATDIAGPRGLLAEGYGILVEPTSGALADAIRRQLSDDPPSRRHFDPDAYLAAAMSEFYALLV